MSLSISSSNHHKASPGSGCLIVSIISLQENSPHTRPGWRNFAGGLSGGPRILQRSNECPARLRLSENKLTIRQINPLAARDTFQNTCWEDFNLPSNIILEARDCQGIPRKIDTPGEAVSSDHVGVVWAKKICNLSEGINDTGPDFTKA